MNSIMIGGKQNGTRHNIHEDNKTNEINSPTQMSDFKIVKKIGNQKNKDN